MVRQAQHDRVRSVVSTLIFDPVNMRRDSADDDKDSESLYDVAGNQATGERLGVDSEMDTIRKAY